MTAWWPISSILASLGVPGYSQQTSYNYISLDLWTFTYGASSVSSVWSDPITYLGTGSGLGSTKSQIQASLISRYHTAGIKVLVSAFGSIEQPCTRGFNASAVAKKLAIFVRDNNLDGVDVEYNDDYSISTGASKVWLKAFMIELRN